MDTKEQVESKSVNIRLTKNVRLTKEAHRQLKVRAAQEGKNLSNLILKLLRPSEVA